MHQAPAIAGASLILVVEGHRPRASSSRHALRGVEQVTIGYAATRRWHRDAVDGTRTLELGVPDPHIVPRHARLVVSGGRWLLEGVGAGVTVNGLRTHRTQLVEGDLVTVGETVLRFREEPVSSPLDIDADADALRPPAGGLGTFYPALARSFDDLAQLAPTATPILLCGETGTGKEVVARATHTLARRPGHFVAVNCGALPATLIESELFGYRKGAFSGATEDRLGLIRGADGGTLFLDEIGDLPLASQAALLRVLQEREVMPLGGGRPVPIDIKLVCATHHDLRALIEQGRFRRDLYARLAGFSVCLPALRDRRDDLGLLIAAILRRLAPDGGSLRLTAAASHALLAHDWPHNIRELDTALGVALALARGGPIDLAHLPEAVRTPRTSTRAAAGLAEAARRDQLEAMLRQHRGNISAIARLTSRSRMQVHRWLKRYQLSPRDFRS
jgi:transcriptional regulator of acetoin/glycerol metabolism